QRRPALQERVVDPIEAIEVVGRPHGVEMLGDDGEHLIELLDNNRLSAALRHADHRCIPAKLYVCHGRPPSTQFPTVHERVVDRAARGGVRLDACMNWQFRDELVADNLLKLQ
ncbi:MAG: hypothetical protein AVDCRST_MAG93-5992, partial [uncultured Chloroflexia bacterium]